LQREYIRFNKNLKKVKKKEKRAKGGFLGVFRGLRGISPKKA